MEKSDAHIDQRKTKIENYFLTLQPSPLSLNTFIYIVSFLMIFGVALMLIFQSKTLTVPVVAFVSIILYRIIIHPYFVKKRNFETKVSDSDINKWLIGDLKTKIQKRAIEYLQLEDENLTDEQFIIIPYPVFHSTQKIEDDQLHRIPTSDGYYNYSFWNVQVLILSSNYLSYYFCSYNWIENEILNEKTSEFFYEDIALVRNDIDQVNFASKWNNNELNEAHILKLINISGDFLYLITELPELEPSPVTIIDQERAVQVLRMILRKIRKMKNPNREPIIQFPASSSKIEHEVLESV
ncbi:MAG: hypothetical protein DRI95_09595 [Bacteroidetes bacterium]|nr:MAG: hypothetical protein DRI95_09595 [Bacteroidota bacterium]